MKQLINQIEHLSIDDIKTLKLVAESAGHCLTANQSIENKEKAIDLVNTIIVATTIMLDSKLGDSWTKGFNK